MIALDNHRYFFKDENAAKLKGECRILKEAADRMCYDEYNTSGGKSAEKGGYYENDETYAFDSADDCCGNRPADELRTK